MKPTLICFLLFLCAASPLAQLVLPPAVPPYYRVRYEASCTQAVRRWEAFRKSKCSALGTLAGWKCQRAASWAAVRNSGSRLPSCILTGGGGSTGGGGGWCVATTEARDRFSTSPFFPSSANLEGQHAHRQRNPAASWWPVLAQPGLNPQGTSPAANPPGRPSQLAVQHAFDPPPDHPPPRRGAPAPPRRFPSEAEVHRLSPTARPVP